MKSSNFNSVLFNVAGVGLVVFLGGYMIQSALHTETVARCSARYGNGQQFSLQNVDGKVMTPIEMQARLPSREWGLLTHARVVPAADKSPFLQVAIGMPAGQEQGQDGEERPQGVQDGVGFLWRPHNIGNSRSACLTYRVYLSKDFPFSGRGTLPGLYSVKEDTDVDATQPQQGFVSRLAWDSGGGMGLSLKTPSAAGMWLPARGTLWPAGRWVTVEQETVLNTPKMANGVMRVWIDGQLKIEHTQLELGAADGMGMSGVLADIGAADQGQAPARVTLTPFVVQAQ